MSATADGKPARSPAGQGKAAARSVVIAKRCSRLQIDRPAVVRVIELLDNNRETLGARSGRPSPGELSVVFLNDEALARLHGEFLDDPSTTDVITFEGDPAHATGGEICVSADTALRYARQHGHDFSEELTLYVVHGWLHLAGHDDLVPKKKRVMRRAEARAMNLLRREDAVPRFRLKDGGALTAAR